MKTTQEESRLDRSGQPAERLRRATLTGFAILLASLASQAGSTEPKRGPESRVGWIVDEYCKQNNANPNGKACTEKCQVDGAALVLFIEETGTILELDRQDLAAANIGYVEVTGRIVEARFEVATIAPQKYRRKPPGS